MIKFVEWCKLFEMMHPVVDEQHQELFRITNLFYDEINKGADFKVIRDALHQLTCYAQVHFEDEEKIMKSMMYPHVEEHKEIHAELIMDIFTLNDNFEKGNVKTKEDIGNFLTKWLVLHILHEDKKFYYFREKMSKERSNT